MNSIKFKNFLRTLWKYKYVILAYLLVLFLTIPLFSLCKSAVPSADDFVYGAAARQAYVETGSVFSVAVAAAKHTINRYLFWQGTYSSIFIMSAQPAVFSLNLYRIAAFVLILICFLCPLFLAYVLNKYMFKSKDKVLYILSAIYSFLVLQFWASVLEGIYWFNGAWYYTFSFEMVILMIAVTVIFEKTQSRRARIVSYIFMLLLSFFLGGTNYPQLLMLTVGYSFFILMIFIRRNPKKWMYVANWLALGIFIAINAFAPGNMGNYAKHVNLQYTALCMLQNFTSEVTSNAAYGLSLASLLTAFPFIAKMSEKSDMKFIKPVYLAIASFLTVFCMYMPSAFIFHNAGPLRQQNARTMAELLLLFVNIINCIGYYVKKEKGQKFSLNPAVSAILIVMLIGTSFSGDKLMKAWSIRAEYSILGMEVSRFTGRMNDIFSELEDENIKSVDLTSIPTNEMLMPDVYSFINYDVNGFYGKEEVIYKKD